MDPSVYLQGEEKILRGRDATYLVWIDDPDLLRKKLLEEVQEIIEATEPDHIAAEAADVLYLSMTRCVAAGVGLREIERHLDQRTLKVWKYLSSNLIRMLLSYKVIDSALISRRSGDAKAWGTANAEQILAASKDKVDTLSAASPPNI